jgi:hypothetical protein
MGRTKINSDCENDIIYAKKDYWAGIEPSIHSAVSTDGLPDTTLYDHLQGSQIRSEAHWLQQLLTE